MSDSTEIRPGYLTTEFWLTLAAQVIAILVLVGVITRDDQQTVQEAISAAIQSSAALATSLGSIWKFIQSRAEVKSAVQHAVVAKAEQRTAETRLQTAAMMSTPNRLQA